MPKQQNPRLNDPEMYEALRDEGVSAQKATWMSNAAAKEGRSTVGGKCGKCGKSKDYENWTVPQLKAKAKEIGLKGYLSKRQDELIQSLPIPAQLITDSCASAAVMSNACGGRDE